MAKETTIIFVYDTELLQREEDDPNSAILYFYPTWVSDQQKTALCGQLMGTIRCLKSIVSIPKMVTLQTGKFFIIENDQFILAVGSDRNIPSWVLDHRANLFYSLVNFFHKDFVNLANLYQNEALNAKLYHIFDTYLKLMLFGGNIYSQVHMLEITKSESTVFMEAIAFLDKCRDFPNALGGTILYHNKVVATHLTASTTKKIVFADPYRIKNPAEAVETNFDLPFGVQLLQVYITNKEFCGLHERALRSRCILQHLSTKRHKRSDTSQDVETQDPLNSLLKRDTSLLFTSVAEEDGAEHSSTQSSVTYRQNSERRSRPNSLNLKSHHFDLNDLKLNCKVTPLTSYGSQASIANTPMTESKIFLHQEHINCLDNKERTTEDFDKSTSDQDDADHTLEGKLDIVPSVQSTTSHLTQIPRKPQSLLASDLNSMESTDMKKLPSDLTKFCFQSMHRTEAFRRSSSLVDLSHVLTSISKDPVQYSRFKHRVITLPQRCMRLKRSKSIHDPIYPFSKPDGLAASQYYFSGTSPCDFLTKERIFDGKNGKIYPKNAVMIRTKIKGNEKTTSDLNQSKPQEIIMNHRKSLTLPIKSLNASGTDRKYSTGVQLTPLMNKLTILAFEEQKAAKMSTLCNVHSKELAELSVKSKENRDATLVQEDSTLQKCVLFVCGQQDTVLGLLLQEDCSKDRDSIEKLWELCTEHLPKLERQINYCLQSTQSKTVSHDTGHYSFLSVDSEWDTTKRSGPWDNDDLSSLSRLHGDFREHEDITDIFLRNEDSVLYGHQSGSSRVFYHETAPVTSGLVSPSDAIGLVQHKARKNLERDHNVVLP